MHTPSPLVITDMRATLKGHVRWQVLDERGVPEIPRSPSGMALAPIEGGQQSNLITNLGMDAVAENSIFTTGSSTNSYGANWRRLLSVGTGSVAPAFTDTALNAPVERQANNLQFPAQTYTYALDTGASVWRATLKATRVCQMGADRNLTEFGLDGGAANLMRIRELFRDEFAAPVTISILTGKYIRVDHTLTVEIPAPELGATIVRDLTTYDVGGAVVSTVPYTLRYGLTCETGGQTSQAHWGVWDPAQTPVSLRRLLVSTVYARINAYSGGSTYDTTSATNYGLGAYTAGTYLRDKAAAWTPGQANGTMYGYLLSSSADNFTQTAARAACLVRFDSPLTYVRSDLDRMTVGFRSSWARV